MPNVLLMTTLRCQKAFVGFLAVFVPRPPEPRGVVQRVAAWWCFAAWCNARFQRRLWSKTGLASRARRLTVLDRSCVRSHACCLLTTPMSAPPHSKVASSICGGFLPTTCWKALYPLSFFLDVLAWFIASQSSSKSVHVCASGPSCVMLKQFPFPILACTFCLTSPPRCRVTSSRVPSLSTFSAKMPVHKMRC